MTKKINRKQKWKNTTLNKANIDEYLQDLYNDTSGNYITQGVSFNKDDSYQMTLLRNALIAHGSFSGFIKSLLYSHFEKHGKLDDIIWQPNDVTIEETEEIDLIEEKEELGQNQPSSPLPSTSVDSDGDKGVENNSEDQESEVGGTSIEEPDKPTTAEEEKSNLPKRKPPTNNSNIPRKKTPSKTIIADGYDV